MKSLSIHLQEYLALRRSLGFKLIEIGQYLKRFLEFLEDKGSIVITSELALQWSTHSGTTSKRNAALRLSHVRQFAQYVSLEDSHHEVPSKYLTQQYRSKRRVPYVYSESDILRLMMATKNLDGTILPYTYETLFGLLFCTGMRISEAINLKQNDFNPSEGKLIIRDSKDNGSRNVFLHPSTVKELVQYTKKRDQIFSRCHNKSFFLSNVSTILLRPNVHVLFQKCLRWAILDKTKPRPRIHDLRHTFIIRTIQRWYQEGQVVEPKLPSLSTYVGHRSPSSTYWYLTATPELMACASKLLSQKGKVQL